MKIVDSISINAPREEVFTIFTDLERVEDHVKGITSIEVLEGSSQMEVGTKWRETRILFGKEATEEMWVTEVVKNDHYAVEADSHGTHYTSHYVFTESGEETRVEMTFEGKPYKLSSRLLGLLGFLFAGATKKALHQDLVDLKNACEQQKSSA